MAIRSKRAFISKDNHNYIVFSTESAHCGCSLSPAFFLPGSVLIVRCLTPSSEEAVEKFEETAFFRWSAGISARKARRVDSSCGLEVRAPSKFFKSLCIRENIGNTKLGHYPLLAQYGRCCKIC